jgi:hypothetical protein
MIDVYCSGASDGGSAVVVALRIRPLNRREIVRRAHQFYTVLQDKEQR